MQLIVIGLIMMLAGLITLFAMVIGMILTGLVLALGAYSFAFTGMMLACFGLLERFGFRRRR